MTEEFSADRAAEILRSGGEIIVSPDVYDAMLGVVLQRLARAGRIPRVSEFLPEGTMLVANFGAVGLKSPWRK